MNSRLRVIAFLVLGISVFGLIFWGAWEMRNSGKLTGVWYGDDRREQLHLHPDGRWTLTQPGKPEQSGQWERCQVGFGISTVTVAELDRTRVNPFDRSGYGRGQMIFPACALDFSGGDFGIYGYVDPNGIHLKMAMSPSRHWQRPLPFPLWAKSTLAAWRRGEPAPPRWTPVHPNEYNSVIGHTLRF